MTTPNNQSADTSGEKLIAAARAVVREALDAVSVHPCDVNDDAVRAAGLYGPMADLYAALAASRATDAPAQADTALKALIANMAAVIQVQNGNKHEDVNALLDSAQRFLDAPAQGEQTSLDSQGLAARSEQKPVAEVRDGGLSGPAIVPLVLWERLPDGTQLYAAPAAPVARVKPLRDRLNADASFTLPSGAVLTGTSALMAALAAENDDLRAALAKMEGK